MAKRKNSRKSKKGKIRTSLKDHTRQGNELLPPFFEISNKMTFVSWMNDRLPEMIWAALLREALGQEYALGLFREFLNYIGKHEKKSLLSDITISGISYLDDSLRDDIISFIINLPGAAEPLATLLFFESIPCHKSWEKVLPKIEPNIELLMSAVGSNLWHQSQEATDCRWLRLMAQVVTGNLHVSGKISKKWFGYPHEGDQRSVRPSIRSAEITIIPNKLQDLSWPNAFWDEARRNTPCFPLVNNDAILDPNEIVTRSQISKAIDALEEHWVQTHSTTAIDARHDSVFGMAFYSLRILQELFGIGVGTAIIGRLGLRTIVEIRITFRYLLNIDDSKFWEKWRIYGAGQAKLNSLKFDDQLNPPKHINTESIKNIANEDLWEEFLPINIGNWSGYNLRDLSKKADLKDVYDSHYSWISGYAHGTWGPVRESCYHTCGNPLHRLHRYPMNNLLPDIVNTAAQQVDYILDYVDSAYPSFTTRIVQKKKITTE